MRKILLTLLLLLTSLSAESINWEKDFNSGIANAKKAKKPVLFVFSRHSCKYCVILDKKTLSDPRVVKTLNKDFISIISYTDENDYTPRELWRPGTPTTWFLKENGQPMFQPVVGAVDAEYFLRVLEVVKKEYKKSSAK